MIFASGLKYVGVGTTALGWILCATLLMAAVAWLVYARPWKAAVAAADGERPSEPSPNPSGDAALPLVHD